MFEHPVRTGSVRRTTYRLRFIQQPKCRRGWVLSFPPAADLSMHVHTSLSIAYQCMSCVVRDIAHAVSQSALFSFAAMFTGHVSLRA